MSTLSVPSKTSEGTFSYAAAASGKHSPKSTTSTTPTNNTTQTNNPGTSTPNGVPADNTKAQTGEVISPDSGNAPLQKTNSPNTTNGPTAVVNGDVSSPSGHSDLIKSSEEKSSNDDKEIQSEGETGIKTIETPKEKLIPAPPPSVNIWNQRAEEFRAKAKLQPATVVAAPPVTTSKPVPSRVSEKASEPKQVDRKRGNKQTDVGNVDTEKSKEGPGHDRKEAPRDGRKRSTDAGRVNGNPSREDGKAKPNKQSAKANAEKEGTVAGLPPSLGDATSWPTPETAQDEEKRERERLQAEKEKEKPVVVRSSGPTKFVPAPFTPTIVHNAPLPTKGGRGGRGGRGGSSGRGANSSVQTTATALPPPPAAVVAAAAAAAESKEKTEKSEKAIGTTSSTQNVDDRGRVGGRGSGLGGRGGYHGPRGGRRTGSVGSNTYHKSEPPVNPSQDKREAHQTVNKAPHSDSVNATASASVSPAQPGNVRQEVPTTAAQQSQEDGAFVGQGIIPSQYPEKPERVPSQGYNTVNGQGYQRVDGSNTHAEGYTPARPERGSVSSRGGYRGRGNHYSNQHNHTTHSNTAPSQQYQHHGQSQYPSHNTSYRGFGRGSRGHSGPPRGYHQPYQPAIYSNQPYSYPYGYPDYNVNHMNPMAIVSVNNSNNPIIEDALAHRDYPQAKDYYANVLRDVTTQMEYYFSVDNLCRDLYLRRHMDSEGWVSLSLFAGFTMIRKHTANIELLRDACQASKEIEVQLVSDGYRVRKSVNFLPFVMPREDRATEVQQREYGNVIGGKKESAKSVSSTDSGRSQMSGAAAPFQPTIPQRKSITSLQSAARNGLPDSIPARAETNGIERTQSQLSADAAEFTMPNGFAPASPISRTENQEEPQSQADFPDEKVSDIVIIYKKSLLDNSSSPEGSPAVNGDISSNCNSDDGTETCQCSPRSGRLSRHGVGWIMEPEATHAYKHEHEKYTVIRTQALQKRLEGEPDSRRMTILYRFWSHFLVNQFNQKMYDEFKSLAVDDATSLSLDILFGFFEAMHLVSSPRGELTQDFVELARKTADNGSDVGISRLETVLKNPHLKPALSNTLRSLYPSP